MVQPRTSIAGRAIPLENTSKFRRLAIVHGSMMAGDAAMVVALADSVFFSVDPSAAREQVLLFLVISFAPFLLLAPLIGPLLDRIAGGRRAVIQVVAVARVVVSILMAFTVDSMALFPLVFVSLVLQKTYVISKSALVPSVVRTEADLVEANSKLGLISGVVGMVAVLPAAIIQASPLAGRGTLIYAALIFGATFVASTWLSADVVAAKAPDAEEQLELASEAIQFGSLAMVLLRAGIGFMFFLMAMVLKAEGANLGIFAVALGGASLGTFIGNWVSPRLKRVTSERTMLLGALVLVAVAGLLVAIVGGVAPLVGLMAVTNFAGAVGRTGFEAILQREAPAANRGRAFATFETRFQIGWAVAGVVPVMIAMSARVGALCVALLAVGGLLYAVVLPRVAPDLHLSDVAGRARSRVRSKIRRPKPAESTPDP